jgi:hypothetical protein
VPEQWSVQALVCHSMCLLTHKGKVQAALDDGAVLIDAVIVC